MYPIMGSGNVGMWHDCMYICKLYSSCNIIPILVAHFQQF